MRLAGALDVLRELAPDGAWIVGGALRDELLGRPVLDTDVALAGDPAPVAAALSRRVRAISFSLSEGYGGWRLVDRGRQWQIDLLPLQGADLTADLAARDLTINALARPLAGGELIDPHGGTEDLRARRLRMVTPSAFAEDPLRVLRMARLACELGFAIDPPTATTARAAAGGLSGVAAERVLAEIVRLLRQPAALAGLEAMDELGATRALLPELDALSGVQQSTYHHLDVGGHTRQVLAETIALTARPEDRLGALAPVVQRVLDEPLANELTRGEALRVGALFHDMAKPQTRAVTDAGRVTFFDHDRQGAELAAVVLRRLRAADRLVDFVAALVRHHLRAGFLVHQRPLTRRAIHRYLRATEPVSVEVTLLSIADRLATRGKNAEAAITGHLEVARELLAEALRWRRDPPRPPVRGDELAAALGLAPGPEIGRLLAELEVADYAGEIEGRQQAIELARRLAGTAPAAER